MRDYGKVYTAFWTSDDIKGASEDARLLAIYLLTCPHGNMIGCFRAPPAYLAEDLSWSVERVVLAITELHDRGYIMRCDRTAYVLVRRYLKWNQFENPNVAKAAAKLFSTLSAPTDLKLELAEAVLEYCPAFPAAVVNTFKEANKGYQKAFDSNSKTGTVTGARAGTETATEAQQEETPSVGLKTDPAKKAEELAKEEDIKRVFEYWQKLMESPRSVLDNNRHGLIRRALEKYSVNEVCRAIRGCRKTPHNMGVNERNTKFNGLDLILRNAEKIDYFIRQDGSTPTAGVVASSETAEQREARILNEVLGDGATQPDNGLTIEMGEVLHAG